MSQPFLYSAAFFGALVVTFLLTPVVAAYARTSGLVDRPGTRKIHTTPVPRIGGVAVFLGLVTGVVAYSAAFGVDRLLSLVYAQGHAALLVPCAIVFVMGLIDDIRGTTPLIKIVVQSAAAMICMQAGYVIDELWTPFGWSVPLGLAAYPLTLLWFIAVTNAYNLIDGLDGLLTSVGIASLAGIAAVALAMGMTGTAFFPIALAGALAGFLYWNWHRAKVFIGDSGALLVGFVVAALSLKVARYAAPASTQGVALHVMFAFAAVPAAETILSLFRRHIAGQPYFVGDSSHIHHVLIVHKGLTVRRAVAMLAVVQLLCSGVAFASRMRLGWYAMVPAGVLLAAAAAGVWWLGYVEMRVIYRRLVHLLLNRSRREIADAVKVARAGEIIRVAQSPRQLIDALRDAVAVGRFSFIALEFTDEGDDAVHREAVPLETGCRAAREYAASVNGKPTWLFAAADEASCTPARTDPREFLGSVRYTVPIPAEDGRLGRLVCERKFDYRGRAASSGDIKAYVAEAIEDAFAAIVARNTGEIKVDSEAAAKLRGQ